MILPEYLFPAETLLPGANPIHLQKRRTDVKLLKSFPNSHTKPIAVISLIPGIVINRDIAALSASFRLSLIYCNRSSSDLSNA